MSSGDEQDLRSEQPLWPLLLFGLSLASVGFYLAFRPAPDTPRQQDEFGIEPQYLVDERGLAPTDPGEPVLLAYGPDGDRRLAFEMRQRNDSGAGTLRTRLAFILSERLRSPDDGPTEGGGSMSPADAEAAVAMEWDFDRVAVSVREGEGEVGRDIVDQVDRLLAGTKQLRTFDRIGVPLSADWTSVTNPQVRETLALLRHAQTLLLPRLPRGRVNAGESWVYQLKSDRPNLAGDGRMKGSVDVETVYRGNITVGEGRELAVFRRTFSIDGVFRADDGQGAQRRVALEGTGSGTTLFEPSKGRVVESRITLDRTMTRSDEDSQDPDAGAKAGAGRVQLYLGERSAP